LPSGAPPWNPAPVFGTSEFESVLATLRADYDAVLIDSAPLTVVSDAAPLLPLVDGVLVVSRVKKSPISAVQELKAMFERVPHVNVVGVVANDVRERNGTYVYSRAYEAKA
jgi:Mrp family chromosome partitioning ATPase